MSNVVGNNEYTHISANTAGVQVGPAGSIRLHAVNINTKGAASNLLTLYDGTSTAAPAVVVAVFDTTVSFGTFQYNVTLKAGLFAVLATGTAADLTISWAVGG